MTAIFLICENTSSFISIKLHTFLQWTEFSYGGQFCAKVNAGWDKILTYSNAKKTRSRSKRQRWKSVWSQTHYTDSSFQQRPHYKNMSHILSSKWLKLLSDSDHSSTLMWHWKLLMPGLKWNVIAVQILMIKCNCSDYTKSTIFWNAINQGLYLIQMKENPCLTLFRLCWHFNTFWTP